ncbi:MAG: prepilin-type N-terminal cleavage/methylation domain-containing protein [Planctomycetota bacterium]
MTTCEHAGIVGAADGFTLIELIVVLAVLGLLVGTGVPLAGAVVQADRRQEAQRELADIAAALDSYWFERAAFPATLATTGFLGTHLHGGVGNTAIEDAFGAGQGYQYSVSAAGVATIYSRGENGIDDGAGAEELVVRVNSAVPGTRRTWQRLRLIVEVLANHIEAGGSVAGAWPAVRAATGLGATYDTDGFGTTLQWTAATWTLTSAGPDRAFGTSDDITL